MNNFEKQINAMLLTIKQYYIERDKNNIEPLSNLLFQDNHQPIIIGTSNSEWCFGIEESKNIFLSDWEGWGNVTIDMESLTFGQSNSLGWFTVKAGVEYVFSNSDEKFSSYMGLVTGIAKSSKPPLVKMSEINWFLSHLLHARKDGERKYIWDMTISGILQNIEGAYTIKTMQFSIPVKAAFPDVRIDTDEESNQAFEQESMRITEFNKNNAFVKNINLKKSILSLFSDCDPFKFDSNNGSQFIGTDGSKREAAAYKEYLNTFNENGGSIRVLSENVILERIEDGFYFCGIGVYGRNITINSELNKIVDNIDYYNRMQNTKEALFKFRRDLALVLKESSVSDKHAAPVRFEGVGRIDANEDICIEYMQISYPFNWILEQKTDASVEI